jgi:hypothetical protein
MKKALANLKAYGRFYLGLRSFLRQKVSLAEAEALVRERLASREVNFLRFMERGVFGNPGSPFLPLLKLADCELGDVRNRVHTDGLEATLRELREAGVYVTFEEFKGRKPMVRNGNVFNVHPRDFDNPHLSRHYQGTTSGTTGAGTRIMIDLDHLAANAPLLMLEHQVHGTLNTPVGIWFGTPPDPTGLIAILMRSLYLEAPLKWFSPALAQSAAAPFKYRLIAPCTIIAGRLFGVPLPWPQPVRLDQAATIAHWATKMVADHGACLITTHVSQALRICMAASEEGLDLRHVLFTVGGEPPSPAKVAMITRTGARWTPKYFFNEVGAVGLGCAQPQDENDMHFIKDSLALIQYPRRVPGSELMVDAFNFTTLLPSAPKLLLNVESDDYGIIETRSCGCPLETYGYTEHLREVRSFRKLTGEGVTLVGSDMMYVLEEVLPSRFGGGPLDYQLLEEEDQKGMTRLSLLISPKVQIRDESEVIATVLDALKRKSRAHRAIELLKQAGTMRIKRQEPISTGHGKFMPLHKAKLAQHPTEDESS